MPSRASCSASAALPCCQRTPGKLSRGSTKSWLGLNRGSKVGHRRIGFALLGENPPQRRLRLGIIGSEPYSLLKLRPGSGDIPAPKRFLPLLERLPPGGFAANAPVCPKETKFIASRVYRVMKRR